jgi:hypothetical protein
MINGCAINILNFGELTGMLLRICRAIPSFFPRSGYNLGLLADQLGNPPESDSCQSSRSAGAAAGWKCQMPSSSNTS